MFVLLLLGFDTSLINKRHLCMIHNFMFGVRRTFNTLATSTNHILYSSFSEFLVQALLWSRTSSSIHIILLRIWKSSFATLAESLVKLLTIKFIFLRSTLVTMTYG